MQALKPIPFLQFTFSIEQKIFGAAMRGIVLPIHSARATADFLVCQVLRTPLSEQLTKLRCGIIKYEERTK
jgi:hypothetical protein